MRIITFIIKDALRKDRVIDKTLRGVENKLIIRPLSKPPMVIDKKNEVKDISKILSILIKDKPGC